MKQRLFNEVVPFETIIGSRMQRSVVRCDWNACGCGSDDGAGNCVCRD